MIQFRDERYRISSRCRRHSPNPRANVDAMLELARRAAAEDCRIVLFPELSLSGYTCADLFHHRTLLDSSVNELLRLTSESVHLGASLLVVGLPLEVGPRLMNA